MQHGGIHVYGHSHGLFEDQLNKLWPGRRAMDVGVDYAYRLTREWRPLSLDEVLHWIEHPPRSLGTMPQDHHMFRGDVVGDHLPMKP